MGQRSLTRKFFPDFFWRSGDFGGTRVARSVEVGEQEQTSEINSGKNKSRMPLARSNQSPHFMSHSSINRGRSKRVGDHRFRNRRFRSNPASLRGAESRESRDVLVAWPAGPQSSLESPLSPQVAVCA